jgi:hypothetical protein
MNAIADTVRLPSAEESIAPVTILDADGHVVRVVSAAEFRQAHPRTTTRPTAPAGAGPRHRAR